MANSVTKLTRIGAGTIEAAFALRGAELQEFRSGGRDLLWNGDPAWWNYRAPILFPVVGKSHADSVTIGGRHFPMGSHGFARELPFELVDADASGCHFVQRASPASRERYPFAYRIEILARADQGSLSIAARITNDDTVPMPYCFGFHPAFLWPFPPSGQRGGHVCRFERPEPGPMRRADAATGLLTETRHVPPLHDRTLEVDDSLFADGSLQFEAAASRRVWFGQPGSTGLDVAFPDCTQLGIWTKPGAPFFCIEPWQGLAAEAAGTDALEQRPGARILTPGATDRYRLILTPDAPDPGA